MTMAHVFIPYRAGEGDSCLQPFQGAVRLRVMKINAKMHTISYLHSEKHFLMIANI